MTELRLAALLAVACLALLGATGRLDFLRREMGDGPRRWIALALLFAVCTLAIFLPVATYGEAQEIDFSEVGFTRLFAGHLMLIAFLSTWWLLAGRPGWRDYLSLPPQPLGPSIRLGLVAGAIGWAATLTLVAVVASTANVVTDVPLGPTEVPPMMLWLADLPAWRKLLIVVVAMTVEEAFLRAFLQRRLGLAVSTALFALAHFNYGLPLLVVAVFAISLVFGAVFEMRRNLVPAVIAHGVFDAIQIFVIIPLALRGVPA